MYTLTGNDIVRRIIRPQVVIEGEVRLRRTVILFCGFVLFLTIFTPAQVLKTSKQKLILSIDSSKSAYKLGEPISLTFQIANRSGVPVTFLNVFGVGTGNLRLEAARVGKDFVGCNNPHWGSLDFAYARTTLQPGGSKNASEDVLWDWRAQDVPRFRFTESGTYYFRATYTVMIEGEKSEQILESLPILVNLEQPKGEDLEVWEKIKDDGFFAYFIQNADILIPSHKTEERTVFIRKVEQIITDHPNSFFAARLRQNLETFRATDPNTEIGIKAVLELLRPSISRAL